jgi:hypothetical protein
VSDRVIWKGLRSDDDPIHDEVSVVVGGLQGQSPKEPEESGMNRSQRRTLLIASIALAPALALVGYFLLLGYDRGGRVLAGLAGALLLIPAPIASIAAGVYIWQGRDR